MASQLELLNVGYVGGPSQLVILALSRVAAHSSFAELDPMRRCQILTNCANSLN